MSYQLYLKLYPCENVNVFNNYFASVTYTAKQNINYSHRHISEYLKHQCNNFAFIQAIDCKEMANIISSLNINKAIYILPFSTPNKTLILLKHDISKQYLYYLLKYFTLLMILICYI